MLDTADCKTFIGTRGYVTVFRSVFACLLLHPYFSCHLLSAPIVAQANIF